MGHGRGRKKNKKIRGYIANPSYSPASAEEYMNDPRPTCSWCNEPAIDIDDRLDPYEMDVHHKHIKMKSCFQCWKDRFQEV